MNRTLLIGTLLWSLAIVMSSCRKAGVPSAPPVAPPQTYHESQTPRILSEWRSSSDGAVSVCAYVDKTTFGATESIPLRCALRNNTGKPLTILRPFGDRWYAQTSGISIVGPGGVVPYRGPIAGYVLGTGAFIELAPHTVTEGVIELKPDVFPSLGEKGLYTIIYTFLSGGYPHKTTPQNYWEGIITANPVSVLFK
ncbi:MAG: hypothetical protein K0R17_820 [Rariglobus sp.]|jgi:hypothetical protein|nr:hypothetical protein [Rariglobus sp.]